MIPNRAGLPGRGAKGYRPTSEAASIVRVVFA
jgi:hypothetical protein